MAITVQNFIKLANYYNQTAKLMSAICIQKGGIAIENYVGRFYMADLLEYIREYGRRLAESEKLPNDIIAVIKKFDAEFRRVYKMTTPTQKPLYEMTLEEFEKVMNI